MPQVTKHPHRAGIYVRDDVGWDGLASIEGGFATSQGAVADGVAAESDDYSSLVLSYDFSEIPPSATITAITYRIRAASWEEGDEPNGEDLDWTLRWGANGVSHSDAFTPPGWTDSVVRTDTPWQLPSRGDLSELLVEVESSENRIALAGIEVTVEYE